MTIFNNHITLSLAISALLVMLNIAAVTNGSADIYYSEIEQFLNRF